MIFIQNSGKSGSKLQRRLDAEIETDKRALDERSFAEACGYQTPPAAPAASKLFINWDVANRASDHAA